MLVDLKIVDLKIVDLNTSPFGSMLRFLILALEKSASVADPIKLSCLCFSMFAVKLVCLLHIEKIKQY